MELGIKFKICDICIFKQRKFQLSNKKKKFACFQKIIKFPKNKDNFSVQKPFQYTNPKTWDPKTTVKLLEKQRRSGQL